MPNNDETEDFAPARTICIEIEATTEQGEADLERIAAELSAILEAAAKQYAYPDGIELCQVEVVDPDEEE